MPKRNSPFEASLAPAVGHGARSRLAAAACSLALVAAASGCPSNDTQTGFAPVKKKPPASTAAATPTPPPSGGCTGSGGSNSGVSGCIDSGPSASPSQAPSVLPTATPVPLGLSPWTLALFVPPPAGMAPLFTPATASLAASGAQGPLGWESSDPAVASVTGTGIVTAGQVGTAVITATDGTRLATASVTVKAEAELAISVLGAMPAGASTLATTVTDASGSVLFTGGATADLSTLTGLTIDARALSAGGVPVAAGRWSGVTLVAGERNQLAIALNAPTVQVVQAGGPGAWITVTGNGFASWHEGSGSGTYAPSLTATLDADPALVAALSDSLAQVQIPQALAGLPATRSLELDVGGVPVAATVSLVGSVTVVSPPATLSLSSTSGALGTNQYPYSASTLDTAGDPVSGAALSWGLLGSTDFSSPTVGTMAQGGLFTPTQTGTATVYVRSGIVIATASLQVVP